MLKTTSIVTGLGLFLLLSIMPEVKAAPATTTSSAGSILGLVEGVNSFCSKVDPQSASSYIKMDQILLDGQSSKVIAQVRNSDAYETAYTQIRKQLQALPASQALAACKAH